MYIVRPEAGAGTKSRLGALPVPKAMLAMTVALRGRLEGLLVFDNLHDENAFDHSDLQRVSRFREHAIGAVAKARTLVTVQEKTLALQQQKEQVEQAYDNVELLSRIGRDITARLSIEEIIGTVYQNVNALMDAAVFGIGLCDEAGERIEFPATRENGEPLPPFGYALTDDSRLAVVCFQRREEIVIEDMAREHQRYLREHKPPVAGKPVASIIYLPLVHKDRAIGVITAQSFRTHAFTDYHLNILRNLATYATIALENADAYRRLNDTLERLQRMQEQLVVQEKLASLGALTAGIAHEIKNPLNFVNNFAELSMELAGELQQSLEGQRDRLDPAVYDDADRARGRPRAQRAKNQRSRPAGRQHHPRHAAALARPLGRAAGDGHQRGARGVRQPVLPRHPRAGLVVQRHPRAQLRSRRSAPCSSCRRTSAACSSTS